MRIRATAAICLALPALVACGEGSDSSALVARAGDYELTVDEVVGLLVDEESLPTQVSVVQSLADLWIDYMLLAEAAAEDSMFTDLDFDGLIRPLIDQAMVLQLRDSVIQVDTAITAEALQAIYEEEAPALQLRARHILLTFPLQATEAQRDSVRTRLLELRTQILAGASFEDMARTFSQDPGSAPQGGDLGLFGRGEMLAPIEEALLELEEGQLSEVVESPLGIHLIRLDERRVQSFDDVADDFRAFVQDQRNAAAESTFIAGLEERVAPVSSDGALEVVRELARAPDTRLSGRARQRALVEWSGGAYTAGDFLDLVRSEQGPLRGEILQSPDEELDGFLISQARGKLLVEEARLSGFEPDQAAVDSLTRSAGDQLRAVTRALGLLTLDQAPGEERERAIARAVLAAIADNLSGATDIVPLGVVGYQLREGVPISILDAGVGQVLLQVAQTRAGRAPSALEESLIPLAEPDDTVGR